MNLFFLFVIKKANKVDYFRAKCTVSLILWFQNRQRKIFTKKNPCERCERMCQLLRIEYFLYVCVYVFGGCVSFCLLCVMFAWKEKTRCMVNSCTFPCSAIVNFVLCAILIPPNQTNNKLFLLDFPLKYIYFNFFASSYQLFLQCGTKAKPLEAKRIALLIDTWSRKLSALIDTLSQCNMQYKIQLETKHEIESDRIFADTHTTNADAVNLISLEMNIKIYIFFPWISALTSIRFCVCNVQFHNGQWNSVINWKHVFWCLFKLSWKKKTTTDISSNYLSDGKWIDFIYLWNSVLSRLGARCWAWNGNGFRSIVMPNKSHALFMFMFQHVGMGAFVSNACTCAQCVSYSGYVCVTVCECVFCFPHIGYMRMFTILIK